MLEGEHITDVLQDLLVLLVGLGIQNHLLLDGTVCVLDDGQYPRLLLGPITGYTAAGAGVRPARVLTARPTGSLLQERPHVNSGNIQHE